MTANHAHTPTKGDLKKAWDFYRAAQANATSRPPNYRAYRWEFLRAWDEIQAAAEQRGAVKALRDAAKVLHDDVDIIIKGNYAVYFREDEADSKGVFPWKWLKNRADQIANKEGQ